MLDAILDSFVVKSPSSLMLRELMESVLTPGKIDLIFEKNATLQYTIAILNQLQKSWASVILINLVLIQSFYKKSHTSLAWENQKPDNELQA